MQEPRQARDLYDRKGGDGTALLVRLPFRARQGRGGNGASLCQRRIELCAVAQPDFGRYGILVCRRAKHGERTGAVMRKIHVQEERAGIPRLIKAGQRIARGGDQGAVEPHMAIALAHQSGMIEIDYEMSRRAGQCQARRRQRDARRHASLHAAGIERVVAGKGDARRVGHRPACGIEQGTQGLVGICCQHCASGLARHRAPRNITPCLRAIQRRMSGVR